MKAVLDSGVGIKWVLQEDLSDKAQKLRDEYQQGMHELLAPDIFTVETMHALTKAERQGRIDEGDGWTLWKSIMTDCPDLHDHLSLLQRAYEIASHARIGIYDCVYVTLAEQEGCDMITADEKLVKNLQAQFPFIVSLDSLA